MCTTMGYATMEGIKKRIEQKVAARKVLVISKTTCNYCAIAKTTLRRFFADKTKQEKKTDYEEWEINDDTDCKPIQIYLLKATGARTVPRIFINGRCIGGCAELLALKQHELKNLIEKPIAQTT